MKIPQFKNFILIKGYQSKELNNNTLNIYRDWRISLLSSFAILFILIVWSLYLLKQIRNDELSKPNMNNSTRSAVNAKKLEAVTNTFLEKETNHALLKNTPLKIVDPSR